jgi:hypothetical protein
MAKASAPASAVVTTATTTTTAQSRGDADEASVTEEVGRRWPAAAGHGACQDAGGHVLSSSRVFAPLWTRRAGYG